MVCTPSDTICGTWATAAPFKSKHQSLQLTEYFSPNALTDSHKVTFQSNPLHTSTSWGMSLYLVSFCRWESLKLKDVKQVVRQIFFLKFLHFRMPVLDSNSETQATQGGGRDPRECLCWHGGPALIPGCREVTVSCTFQFTFLSTRPSV